MLVYFLASAFCIIIAALHGFDSIRTLRRGNQMLVQAQRMVVTFSQPELAPMENDPEVESLPRIPTADPYSPAFSQYVLGAVYSLMSSAWLFAGVYMQVKAWT